MTDLTNETSRRWEQALEETALSPYNVRPRHITNDPNYLPPMMQSVQDVIDSHPDAWGFANAVMARLYASEADGYRYQLRRAKAMATTIPGMQYDAVRVKTSPSGDAMGRNCAKLDDLNRQIKYCEDMANLYAILLIADCRDAGFNAERINAIILHYMHGYSYADIAKRMGLKNRSRAAYLVRGTWMGDNPDYSTDYRLMHAQQRWIEANNDDMYII